MMDMSISLIAVNISKCIHMSKHHVVDLKYNFSFVNYVSIKLERNTSNMNMLSFMCVHAISTSTL